jgi:hypothetical protein
MGKNTGREGELQMEVLRKKEGKEKRKRERNYKGKGFRRRK